MLDQVTALGPEQQGLVLFAGLAITLVVASMIGYTLKVSVAHGAPHGVIDNLNARIRTWWWIVLGLLGVGAVLWLTIPFLWPV